MTNQSTARPFRLREFRPDDIPVVRCARKRGYREVRAHNDTANPPILRMNEKLGYHRLPGWLQWEKLPHREQTAQPALE